MNDAEIALGFQLLGLPMPSSHDYETPVKFAEQLTAPLQSEERCAVFSTAESCNSFTDPVHA